MTWRGDSTPVDRMWSCLVYLLPMTSALALGANLMMAVPPLALLFQPLIALTITINQFGGYTSLVLFLVLYFLVIRNTSIKHFIRFNAIQALLVDIARFLGVLLLSLFGQVFSAIGLDILVQSLQTTIFLAVVGVSVFAWVQNIRGRYPEVPVLSEAAYSQVRY